MSRSGGPPITPKLWEFHTLPRAGQPESHEVGAFELPDGYVLVAKRRTFEEAPDPMLAVDLIVLCAKAGVYPPGSVVDWLAGRLHEWHEAQGRTALEVALGIRKGVQGATNPFEQSVMAQRDDMYCDAVARLRCLGATVDQAAHAVWRRFEDGAWNTSPFKIRPLSKVSIVDLWNDRGAKTWRHDVLKRGLELWAANDTSVAKFLGAFDPGDLPKKVNSVRKRISPTQRGR